MSNDTTKATETFMPVITTTPNSSTSASCVVVVLNNLKYKVEVTEIVYLDRNVNPPTPISTGTVTGEPLTSSLWTTFTSCS